MLSVPDAGQSAMIAADGMRGRKRRFAISEAFRRRQRHKPVDLQAWQSVWDGDSEFIETAVEDGVIWQAASLHDAIYAHFRPSPPLPPAVLAWNGGTVRRMAEGIYEDRKLPEGTLDAGRLAILADALLDAGCDNEALIQHCRGEGPHVRGCWAVDLILGKQ
jgi:hypothetical protein